MCYAGPWVWLFWIECIHAYESHIEHFFYERQFQSVKRNMPFNRNNCHWMECFLENFFIFTELDVINVSSFYLPYDANHDTIKKYLPFKTFQHMSELWHDEKGSTFLAHAVRGMRWHEKEDATVKQCCGSFVTWKGYFN